MQYNKMDIVQVSEEYLWGINLHPNNWFIDRQILRSFRDLGESNILVLFDENGKLKQKENQLMKWLAPTDQAVATRYDRIKEQLTADGIHLIPEVQEILKGAPQWSAEEIRATGKQYKERYGVWTDGSAAIREQEQRAGYGVFWNFNNSEQNLSRLTFGIQTNNHSDLQAITDTFERWPSSVPPINNK
jgi:hypothetical protein